MDTLAVRPESIEDVPDLETLEPLGALLKKVGLSLQAGHRWRLHPTTPLRCWKVGHQWMSTEDELRDFIRRRSGGQSAAPGTATVHSARRQREIRAAYEEASALLRSTPRRPA